MGNHGGYRVARVVTGKVIYLDRKVPQTHIMCNIPVPLLSVSQIMSHWSTPDVVDPEETAELNRGKSSFIRYLFRPHSGGNSK